MVEQTDAEFLAEIADDLKYNRVSDYAGTAVTYSIGRLIAMVETLTKERDDALAELERECMRLAVCGVIAMANTPSSAAQARQMHTDYWSASAADVARAVDREIALRSDRDAALARIEALPSGWRDIATAPKRDRKKRNDVLLGSFPKEAVAVGEAHRPPRDCFTTMDGTYHAPTHWQPLPAPPKQQEPK